MVAVENHSWAGEPSVSSCSERKMIRTVSAQNSKLKMQQISDSKA